MKNKGTFSGMDVSAKAFASQRKDFYEEAITTMRLVRAVLSLVSILLCMGIIWMANMLFHTKYWWVLVVLGALWIVGILVKMGKEES